MTNFEWQAPQLHDRAEMQNKNKQQQQNVTRNTKITKGKINREENKRKYRNNVFACINKYN